jgi:hypothetical protein
MRMRGRRGRGRGKAEEEEGGTVRVEANLQQVSSRTATISEQ